MSHDHLADVWLAGRYLHLDEGAFPFLALYVETAVQQASPLLHARQPEPPALAGPLRAAGIEPLAVILDV